jgi:hypothetical protein
VCADQWYVEWLVTALHVSYKKRSDLRAVDDDHLRKPIKMAVRTGNKLSMGPEELLKWIKSLNSGLHMENWRIYNFRNKPSDRRLIPYVDWESSDTIKRTGDN